MPSSGFSIRSELGPRLESSPSAWDLRSYPRLSTRRRGLPSLSCCCRSSGQEKGVVPINQQRLAAPARETIVRFLVERHVLGKLRRRDDVAQAVFSVRNDLHSLVVVVEKMALDQETARMVSTKDATCTIAPSSGAEVQALVRQGPSFSPVPFVSRRWIV